MDSPNPNRFPKEPPLPISVSLATGEPTSTLTADNSNFDDNEDDYGEENLEYEENRKRSSSADKRKQQRKPPAPLQSQQPKSPLSSSQQSNRTSIASQQQQQQPQQRPQQQHRPPPINTAATKPSPQHMSRQQVYQYEQENVGDDDEDGEDEDDEDEQDENYPLSQSQQAYQQSRMMHQQKMIMVKKQPPEIGFKTGNVSNANSMSNIGSGQTRGSYASPTSPPTGPPYHSVLKATVNAVQKPVMGMGTYTSGYEINAKDGKIDLWGHLLVGLSYFFLVISFPFSLCACVKVAQEYERAVIFRLGRILAGGAKGPGIFFVLPCIDTYTKVDLRTVTFDVPPQEILTKDSVTVSVDAVVYFRIFNAVISVINVEDAAKSTKLLAASTLRNILGTKSLHEILSDRESVAILIQNNLDEATGPWGVKVERVEVKDVRLPVQLQRAMATEAEAAREARAKVIAAEGEQKASKALKEAAEVISESPIAIQLRYLQTLTQIASEKNSTIVFPIPLEMLSFLANKTAGIFKVKN